MASHYDLAIMSKTLVGVVYLPIFNIVYYV